MSCPTYKSSAPLNPIAMSQNTAPILEYRCLFSTDPAKKKKKKWHDGLLRFHTFNNRIMVWDEQRNYIGDSHWRDDESVQEGDELTLDKGPCVQVGERTGEAVQDLTELLNSRRKNQESSLKTAQTVENSALRQTPVAQEAAPLMPKSLNAILGKPTGTIGRATLPRLSPYAEKHDGQANQYPDSRGAKRRKLVHTGDESVEPVRRSKQRADLDSNTLCLTSQRPPLGLAARRRLPLPQEHIIEVSSDEESRITTSPMRTISPQDRRKDRKSARSNAGEICHDSENLRRAETQIRRETTSERDPEVSRKEPKKAASRRKGAPIRLEKHHSDVAPVPDKDERPLNRLRTSKTKRRMLMNRDLIVGPPDLLGDISNSQLPEMRSKMENKANTSTGPRLETTKRSKDKSREVNSESAQLQHSENKGMAQTNRHTMEPANPLQVDDFSSAQKVEARNAEGGHCLSQDYPMSNEGLAELARLDVELLANPTERSGPATSFSQGLGTHYAADSDILLAENVPEDNPVSFSRTKWPLQHSAGKPVDQTVTLPPQPQKKSALCPAPGAASSGIPPSRRLVAPRPAKAPLQKSFTSPVSRCLVQQSTTEAQYQVPTLRKASSDSAEFRRRAQKEVTVQQVIIRPAAGRSIKEDAWEDERDAWSRETFDLFGWRPGDPKKWKANG